MMRSIAFLSEKGGTGKTTSALNVAAGLAKKGEQVLVVDADPQGNSSLVLLEGRKTDGPTLSHVLLGNVPAVEAIVPTAWAGVSLLPADPGLAEVNIQLSGEIGRERRLRSALEGIFGYTFAVADCGPARSLLNVNVLNCFQEVIVPIDPSLFSLSGLAQLQEAIGQVRRFLDNRQVRVAGLLLTRLRKDSVSRDVEQQLREMFGPLVLRSGIPHSVRVEEGHSRFLSVLEWSPKSAPAKAYLDVVEEIVNGHEEKGTGPAGGEHVQQDPRRAA